jgi:MYXO-CTERM domain-containing protein
MQAGDTIPGNTEALVWRPRTASGMEPDVSPSNVRLRENDWQVSEVAVEVEKASELGPNAYLIKPQASWKNDDYRYTFTGADFCDDGGDLQGDNSYQAELFVDGQAPTMSTLGTLKLAESKRGSMTTWGRGGMCESEVEAEHRTLNLELSEGASAWKNNLVFRTQIRLPGDDQYDEWSQFDRRPDLVYGANPDSVLPRTTAVDVPTTGAWLYRVCDEDRSGGLPEGRWKVRMEAYRPATGDTWTSNTVEVPLSCGELPPPSADTGVGSDAGGDGNSDWQNGQGDDSGCSTTGPASPSGAVLLFVGGLLALVSRQRR